MIFLFSTPKIQRRKKAQTITQKIYIQKLKHSYTALKTHIY